MSQQIYETSWWEYVREPDGKLKYTEFENGVASPFFRNLKTGEVVASPDLPVGALWADYRHPDAGPKDYPRLGPDGISVVCRTLGGSHWNIDGRASNCTKPNDHEHRCWVRHGTVGERLTVDKNGLTCEAGAGSIFMGRNREWHGFLRDGKLTP